MSKMLLIGGTGALGTYLTQELLARGNEVHVLSLDDMVSDNPMLTYFKGNAKDDAYLTELLKNNYDGVVDYMIYFQSSDFAKRVPMFLDHVGHYIFLSTYRIYADSATPITEESDRLLDVATDPEFLNSNDYALYKAEGEDILARSGYRNWTVIRPSITYSKRRFQLVTLEANVLIHRIRHGKTVIVPEEAMNKQTSMTWSGDSAKMVASLLCNEKAFGERYTISTGEHHSWREVCSYYEEIAGMKYITVDTETYVKLMGGDKNINVRQQLTYDRLFNREVDNSKILAISGLKQEELMPLKEGLRREYEALPLDWDPCDEAVNARMDAYLAEHGID